MKVKSYSRYPWIMDRLKRENPEKDEDSIKKMYLSITKSQSLPCLIEKYGEEEGKRRYEARNKNVAKGHTLKGFIDKYGEDEGTSRYKSYTESNKSTLENLIKRHGEDEGKRRYENLLKSLNRSKESYIDRLGEEDGLKEYNKRCSKISESSKLSGFKKRYGDEKGELLYNLHAEKSKNTLDTFKLRYGEDEGTKKWKEYVIKLSKRLNSTYSKVSIELFDSIKEKLVSLGYDETDMYYGPNEIGFCINNLENSDSMIVKPDFYLKSKKLAVEFYGDYWHKNPESLAEDDNGESYGSLWDWDKNRIRSMYHSEFIEAVEIVWESEYNSNKEETVNKLIKFLTEYGQD